MITTGPLRVKAAATVVCIRRAPGVVPVAPLTVEEATCNGKAWEGAGGDGPSRMSLVFGTGAVAMFVSAWEALMGQSEVQNWVRSSPSKAVPMRYPGEWKFAGGTIEPGETPEMAAKRELEEEFHVTLPSDENAVKLHLLSVKQTRPIGNVSNIMYNYVAAADENPWLAELDLERVNATLSNRRDEHSAALEAGHYWSLSKLEREKISPEVREVQWLDMRTAVLNAFTSMNDAVVPVNEFQAGEFARMGIERRDPMFLTMASLLEVDSFPSLASLARHASSMRPDEELRRVQWLEDGMSPEEVAAAWERHSSPLDIPRRGMFSSAEERMALRVARAREDAEEHGGVRDANARL